MRVRRSTVLTAMLVPLAVIAAACGQKSGVEGSADAGGAPPATAAPGTAASTTGAPGDSTAPGDTAAPGDTTAPDETDGTEAAATTAAPVAPPFTPGTNDAAGVSDTEIVIGIHAPVTGASPVPQTSFDAGKDIYWNWLAASAPDTLFGRRVRVVFRDDEFNPQHAVQVCREMVEQEGAFLLIGAAGADQITACATYAAENGIPYLSPGVNEEGLTDVSTYFATSMTYAQQAPLLVADLQARGLDRVGLVVADTPSFDDFVGAFEAAASEAGVEIAYENRINKSAAEPEQLSVVQALKSEGLEGVVLLSSATVFIGLSAQGLNQSYTPAWLGPGVTSGINAVTGFGCPAVETGSFFSPYPQLDVIDSLDPDFNIAYTEVGDGATADDVGIGLWALNKFVALVLEATGEELGRAAFLNTLVTTPEWDNGIYAPLRYTVDNHFGGTGAHLLDADCAIKQYITAEQFVTAG